MKLLLFILVIAISFSTAQDCALSCQNNGICVINGTESFCDCTGTGYQGALCETDIDECDSIPCTSPFVCVNKPGTFSCQCLQGFQGPNCTDINECLKSPCSPLTTCTNIPGSYVCGRCPRGYSGNGHNCTDINECDRGACDKLTKCINTPGSYRCTNCPMGYTGNGAIGCVDVDECARGACDPLTTCTNTIGSFNCSKCPNGYIGSTKCTAVCDPPCVYGKCAKPNVCECQSGYKGTLCESESDSVPKTVIITLSVVTFAFFLVLAILIMLFYRRVRASKQLPTQEASIEVTVK